LRRRTDSASDTAMGRSIIFTGFIRA
jgi:hypothetical protein